MSFELRKCVSPGTNGTLDGGTEQDYLIGTSQSDMIELGARWIRLWVDWATLEPKAGMPPGSYSPSSGDPVEAKAANRLIGLDQQINKAKNEAPHLRIMLVIHHHSPLWTLGIPPLIQVPRNADGTPNPYAVTDSMLANPNYEPNYQWWDRGAYKASRALAPGLPSGSNPNDAKNQRVFGDPSRKGLERRFPYATGFSIGTPWANFLDFLVNRYSGPKAGPWIDAIEIVNEPNLTHWPQQEPAPPGSEPDAPGNPNAHCAVVSMMQSARVISANHGNRIALLAPALSDTSRSNRRVTPYNIFTRNLLATLQMLGFVGDDSWIWSHHNYTDIEQDRGTGSMATPPRECTGAHSVKEMLLEHNWRGRRSPLDPVWPAIWLTEGGARLDVLQRSMQPQGVLPAIFPPQNVHQLHANLLQRNWNRMRDDIEGAGMGMVTQYLVYSVRNYDCGLRDPVNENHGPKRQPQWDTWKNFPGVE